MLTQNHDPGYRLTSHRSADRTPGNGRVGSTAYGRSDNRRTSDTVNDGSVIEELDFDYSCAADSRGSQVGEPSRTTAGRPEGGRKWRFSFINGNLVDDDFGERACTWDLDNRLIEVESTINAFQDITYRYDALGRRIVREQSNNQEVLLWWGMEEQSEHHHRAGQETIQNDLLACPKDGALNTVFARVLEGDLPDVQYFHKNYLDHVMAVSDRLGNVIEHYRYTAFGEVSIFSSTGTLLSVSAIGSLDAHCPVSGM